MKLSPVLVVCLCFMLFIAMKQSLFQADAQGEPIYVVQPGDSLGQIAIRYGINVSQLAMVNGLRWDAWLYTGQRLIIPKGDSQPTPIPPAPLPRENSIYIVRPGDTLLIIASRYGISVATLRIANKLTNHNQIYPGQRLTIPLPVAVSPTLSPQPTLPLITSSTPLPIVTPLPTPTLQFTVPITSPAIGEKWIEVDLAQQTATAYEGVVPVLVTKVSTGIWKYPTVVGTFAIYSKYEAVRMRGGRGVDAYDLPNVPHVLYFHGSYALHGAYWHNSFGTPMSHGCVNLPLANAKWLYNWAPIGTKVVIH